MHWTPVKLSTLWLMAVLAILTGCGRALGAAGARGTQDEPSLVVLVVIDQLPNTLLSRYDSLFSAGFRRLLNDGYRFTQASHDFAETATGPGHATLATGVFPARHGIVGNEWLEERDGEWTSVYSVEDLDSPILGLPRRPGRSPANLRRAGLADWIQAADPAAQVVTVSSKDRAAISLAGRAAGEVYWLISRVGGFVTSEFYHSEYPAWVARFNEQEMPRLYSDLVWESSVPLNMRGLTRPDTSAYELDGVHTYFPHRAADHVSDRQDDGLLNRWRYERTPFPDAAVLRFAEGAIAELKLGQGPAVDYLGLAFSQTDLIGHRFGPLSREQLDNLLRLDELLGQLLTTLDERVGEGRWVLALSSDHGVLEIPEHLAERGEFAERLDRDDRTALRDAVAAALIPGLDGEALARSVKASVSTLPWIERAYTFGEIEDPSAHPDSFAVLFSRSHSRERALGLTARYGVHVRLRENTLEWGGNRATHGSPYYYDRAVPLVFLGAGVSKGESSRAASTVDVAPTLAQLAGIDYPDDLDGMPLLTSTR